MSSLSDYLNDHLPETWTKRQLIESLAGTIDRATVYRYLSGSHPRNPSNTVLEAFASVLPGATLPELRHAAATPGGIQDPWVPPLEAHRLNSGQRAALTAFIRATINWQDYEPGDDTPEPPAINLDQHAGQDVQSFLDELQASGMSDFADRLAATLAINSASDTANKSSKD